MRHVQGLKLREIILFLIGVGIMGHEVIYTEGERPFLIAAALAMMGFPLVLRSDVWARRNGRNGNGNGGDGKHS